MDVINRLKFDPNCIGSDLMALSVKPVYLYENGKRVSDEVVSFKYEILCPALGYEKTCGESWCFCQTIGCKRR